ncbi:MAG: chitobiase/beta-hexosaminidase C-terminal domain-containing protein [Bacteroidetes bacterium]|nr:chitobiase/beta-hexosaminidase C-terminal domain-containing protein [Bacteroidota bacterium]
MKIRLPEFRTLFLSLAILKALLLAAVFLMFDLPANASLRIPSILASNMVLQRNSEVRIWGWGDPGKKITVKVGWLPNELSANVNSDGRWQVKVLTGNAGGPYKISISESEESLELNNILLGEVWVCSGQSNMDFTIKMLGGWKKSFPAEMDDVLKNDYSKLRLFDVKKDTSSKPLEECFGTWLLPDTGVLASFSATAWFFGLELYKELGVPIGLVTSAWGGTPAEAWTPKSIVDTDPALIFYRSDPNKNPWFPTAPAILFNSMINPLLKTTIKGAIWYQGESNVNDADTYGQLFPAMVKGWRQAWAEGDFPFYYVQIAPFTYDRAVVGALMRETQLKCLSMTNSGMAVTMDIAGDVTNIHPVNKPEVGRRLALCALAGTYEKAGIAFSGPVYRSFTHEGKTLRLYFEHTEGGLLVKSHSREDGFMIAGKDKHFVPAKVKVESGSLVVKSDKVKEPESVRYAFTNTSDATLFNGTGLPASTFRTDNWPLVTALVFMKPSFDKASGKILYDLSASDPRSSIHYTLDGVEPTCSSRLYSGKKINLNKPGLILARVCIDSTASESIGSWEVKQHKAMASAVSYQNPYSERYTAGGMYGLVDGVEGSVAFNDGAWQGFEGTDLDVVVDLGELTLARKISVHFLADTNSWIFAPKHVEIRTSQNGFNYDAGTRYDNMGALAGAPGEGKQVITLKSSLMKNIRYIRVRAVNIGVCPPGHPGAGEKAWLFVDEIEVE